MRSVFLSLVSLAPVFLVAALPIPNSMQTAPDTTKDIEILDFNFETAWTKFAVAPGFEDGALSSPLVFELNVNPVQDILSSNITINQQRLNVKWDTTDEHSGFFATVASPTNQVLAIEDKRGKSHLVDVAFSGYIAPDWRQRPARTPEDTQHLSLRILTVDELTVKHFELDIVLKPNSSVNRLVKLYRTSDMHLAKLDGHWTNLIQSDTILDANPFEQFRHDGHTIDIEAEIETLLLLEAEAGDLDAKISAKKQKIAECLKDHRDRVSLKHLLSECDGVVCAAKVIAQRICDKIGVLTTPNFQYVQMQDPEFQSLIGTEDDTSEKSPAAKNSTNVPPMSEKHANATVSDHRYFALHTNGAAVNIVYPQTLLIKVLGIIASALGLTALFSFIRRKCMSARSKVERLAEREERRNARAYRRAARRADMRRRWDAFVATINCFRAGAGPPRIEDYEEKRALILQDAFLEQDTDTAEKGEIMEAEIRELRNAHQIVSGLVGVNEYRYDLRGANDPSPPLVPLPYTPAVRSRASTATLPSYTSEVLPDYRSRVSIGRTSRSSSIIGSTMYSSTTASDDQVFSNSLTGSTPRSLSPEGSQGSRRSHSVDGSRRSRYTPTSSVIEVSPRNSDETIRIAEYRRSLALSRRSRDTNDL